MLAGSGAEDVPSIPAELNKIEDLSETYSLEDGACVSSLDFISHLSDSANKTNDLGVPLAEAARIIYAV